MVCFVAMHAFFPLSFLLVECCHHFSISLRFQSFRPHLSGIVFRYYLHHNGVGLFFKHYYLFLELIIIHGNCEMKKTKGFMVEGFEFCFHANLVDFFQVFHVGFAHLAYLENVHMPKKLDIS